MSYSFGFLGRPRGGASFIASYASTEYKASMLTGSYPYRKSNVLTADLFFFSLSAISLTVKNSFPLINIYPIIGSFHKKFTTGCILLNKCIGKFRKKIKKCYQKTHFVLTLNATSGII